MKFFFFLILAYLLGSIPFGYLVAKVARGIDIREHGSRSIGATNVFRVLGKNWGALVFSLDVLKGYLAVQAPIFFKALPPAMPFLLGLAVAAILGHAFPLSLGFRGGKGVATSFGVFLGVAPLPTLLSFGIWVLALGVTRIISASSLVAAVSFPTLVYFLCQGKPGFIFLFPVSFALTIFIFYTHRQNIGRLIEGKEKQIF